MKNEELIDSAKRFVENHNCWVDSYFTAEEKADEIAGLRNNDAFEWMADFAEKCIKEERKRIAELEKALDYCDKRCASLHHPKKYQHGDSPECPVEALVNKALRWSAEQD